MTGYGLSPYGTSPYGDPEGVVLLRALAGMAERLDVRAGGGLVERLVGSVHYAQQLSASTSGEVELLVALGVQLVELDVTPGTQNIA